MYHTQPGPSLQIVSFLPYDIAVAFVNPNGITVYSNSPFLVRKAVFHSCPAAKLMWLNPFCRFRLVNHWSARVWSHSSLMRGSRYLVGLEMLLCLLQSMTGLRNTSILHTNSIGAPVASRENLILPVRGCTSRYFRCCCFPAQVVLSTATVRIFACGC